MSAPNYEPAATVLAAGKGWVLAMLAFGCAWLRSRRERKLPKRNAERRAALAGRLRAVAWKASSGRGAVALAARSGSAFAAAGVEQGAVAMIGVEPRSGRVTIVRKGDRRS